MNQILKDIVYGKGTMRQVLFLAEIGGMTEEETSILIGIHKRKPDAVIRDELCLSRKAYERLEASVRSKLTIAIFECINSHMNN